MTKTLKLWWVLIAVLAAGGIFWSCDRLDGTIEENKPPVVEFVNVPLDSSQFSFAPTVYWVGHDPDGFLTGFQYRDDASDEAVAAYRAGDAALQAYIAGVPETSWIPTDSTQETIYLLTDEGDTTEHVFMIRSVDDRGATSAVRIRIFFRTNQAPNKPEIKKVQLPLGEDQPYDSALAVTDTLFIGEVPSATWGGISFLWRGTDPDSRELNIIPLEFSYRLTNLTTGTVIPFPRLIDSTNFEWVQDWHDWTSATQVVYSGVYPGMGTGNYLFEVKSRDDGLTESAVAATATFYAIRPSFAGQLLLVDENKPLTGPAEPVRGGRNDQEILDFYDQMLPEAFELAEMVRPVVLPDLTEPFDYNNGSVQWFQNKNVLLSIPYALIHEFKWVWLIDDDNAPATDATNTLIRQRVMSEYMDIGGQVMISGRRTLMGTYGLLPGDNPTNTVSYGAFFNNYFNLKSANAKAPYSSANDETPEFGGATTTNPYWPQLEVDTSVTMALRWGSAHFPCLPEIDYYGRDNTVSGYDFSQTLYNYQSCTAQDTGLAENADLEVVSSTPSMAILRPLPGHTRILEATDVFNITRSDTGEFMYPRFEEGEWRLYVSTHVSAGAWTTEDVLRVDYTYIPTSINHDKPVATQYTRMEGIIDFDFETGEFSFVGETRFRSSLIAFPFSFMKTTPVDVPLYGLANPVAVVVANQMLFFNSPREIVFNQGD